MVFQLSTTATDYYPDDAKRLANLGFDLEQPAEIPKFGPYGIIDGKRIALFSKVDRYQDVQIEFSSFDELRAFGLEWGRLVIDFEALTIEIYDDYRE